MAGEGKGGEKKNQQITRGPQTKSDKKFYCQVDDEREGDEEEMNKRKGQQMWVKFQTQERKGATSPPRHCRGIKPLTAWSADYVAALLL